MLEVMLSKEGYRPSTVYRATEGLELLDRALIAFAIAGHEIGQAECWRMAANWSEPNKARDLLDLAIQAYRRHGMRSGVAACYNALGDIDRRQGSFTSSEDRYKRARNLFDAVGSRDGSSVIPRLNLGLLYLEREDYTRARRSIEEARAALVRTRRLALVGVANTLLVAV